MIHWLVQSFDDCPAILRDEAPPGLLDKQEQERLRTLTVGKRRRDWLLGRWTAKHLVQQYLAGASSETVALDQIAIGTDADGAPFAVYSGTEPESSTNQRRLPISLSISHSHGHAFCALIQAQTGAALAPPARRSVGCDIEYIETREESFVRDFFTREEMEAVVAAPAGQRDGLVTALWSGKEAVLKAVREGLRVDTRQITCRFASAMPPATWEPFTVELDPTLATRFPGVWSAWWWTREHFVLTIALREET